MRFFYKSSDLRYMELIYESFEISLVFFLLQVQDLVLKELYLQGCKELTDYSVEILVKHQPGVLKLDISGCTELTSRSVDAVARGLKSLTHLSLSRRSVSVSGQKS